MRDLDARIPLSSRNPDIDALTAGKPRLIVLNHTDQADSERTKLWAAYFRSCGCAVLETAAKSGAGIKGFQPAVRALLADKLRRYEEKGQAGRTIRVMVGDPQCGQIHLHQPRGGQDPRQGGKPPGRHSQQPVGECGRRLELLDTPGILWPKFEDQQAALRLAFIGAIRDEVMDLEELACYLMEFLRRTILPVLKSAIRSRRRRGRADTTCCFAPAASGAFSFPAAKWTPSAWQRS